MAASKPQIHVGVTPEQKKSLADAAAAAGTSLANVVRDLIDNRPVEVLQVVSHPQRKVSPVLYTEPNRCGVILSVKPGNGPGVLVLNGEIPGLIKVLQEQLPAES